MTTVDGGGSPGDRQALAVRVHGTVQGVFFRATCRDRAQQAGVAGWVRNESDGTVSAVFEGPADAVLQMVAWCHEGSPQAEVRGVEASRVEVAGFEVFEVR